jgi:hypothetical protein
MANVKKVQVEQNEENELINEVADEVSSPIQLTVSEKVLNMDSYSTCRNICSWDIYFSLVQGGDKLIKANGSLDMSNRDIVSLCNNNNIFFVGDDGQGSHARVYIENPMLRIHEGFESEDGTRKQKILNTETLQSIFNQKTQKQFELAVHENVIAFHEKDIIMEFARKIKLNDYDKISFLEAYTGRSFRN